MSEKSSTQINPNDLREVVNYISKIKDYDRSNFIKLQQINDLVWGIMFLIAGITDFLFHLVDRPEMSRFAWAVVSFGGMFISIYINSKNSRRILTEEINEATSQMAQIYKFVIFLTILAWLGMTLMVVLFNLLFLILPMVTLLIGTTILGFNFKYSVDISASLKNLKRFYDPKLRTVFIPFLCYLSTIVNLVGYAINPEFISYMGIILGIMLFFGFGSGAFVEWK